MKHKNNNKAIWIALGVGCLVFAIGVAIVVILNNQGGEAELAEDTSSQEVSMELKSGSVTTEIGGKKVTYSAAYVVDGIEAKVSAGTFVATEDNQNVFLVINGGKLTIEGDVTIKKSGSEGFAGRGDEYSFYGTNSAIAVVGEGSSLAMDGAGVDEKRDSIDDGVRIYTDTAGANAVVATDGSEAVVGHTMIQTSEDNSRGLHATYGGEIVADQMIINTSGGSSAALATDRGSGKVTVINAALSTAGAGSPLIYSTGNITVTNSAGKATGAQIAVVEGSNSITLDGCQFEANGVGNRNNVDNAGVMIYQSMSGDASEGEGSFTATDSTLTVTADSPVYNDMPFFFVTNTTANIDLTNVTAKFAETEKFISAVSTDEWGRSGKNGGVVKITTSGLTAPNTDVEVDDISSVSGL